MATTQLFVELLVIGFGVLAALLILGAVIFDYQLAFLLTGGLSAKAAVPLLVAAYVLGIVADRIADRFFERFDARYRKKYFGADQDCYFHARRTLMLHGQALWEHLEYGRSRLRICRGWVLNSALLAVAVTVFAFARSSSGWKFWLQVSLSNIGLISFGALCAYCWRSLTEKEYKKIERQSAWIEKQQEQKSNGGTGKRI